MTAESVAHGISARRSQTVATGTVFVRDATHSDLTQIVAIYNEAVASRTATAQLEPVTVESRRHWLESDYPFLVGEVHGVVVGWLSFKEFLPRCAYRGTVELSVYVAEESRGRGVAGTLLQNAITRATDDGYHSLLGLIFSHNTASLRVFEASGFARWGSLPGVARVEGVARDVAIVGRHV